MSYVLTPATPESLGLDGDRLRAVDALAESSVTSGICSAAVYLVLRYGRIAAEGAFGVLNPSAEEPAETRRSSIFDMASLSKPITATLLLQFVEEGVLHLGQPVADFL
ncbi:MAG TPA: serine hydrolase domain-containing protein, partial [Chthonomonadales bacterium]|nr:serine hydrolase domain-containing protein [Chthonomonadales bacterium]